MAGTDLEWLSEAVIDRVPLDQLVLGIQIRCSGTNAEHVRVLRETADLLPPIIVHRETGVVVDGVHRLLAARARGEIDIAAVFFDGDPAEAFVLALRLNSIHGLPLTRRDRRDAVVKLLQSFPDWSDRRLALTAGVSPSTVAAVRRSSAVQIEQPNIRTGLDGRTRPVDRSERRQRVLELLRGNPQMSIRQVARAAGVSVSTVHHAKKHEPASEPVADPAAEWMQAVAPPLEADLAQLRQDPAMRASFATRDLLRLIFTVTPTSDQIQQLTETLPVHQRPRLARILLSMAQTWSDLAHRLDTEF